STPFNETSLELLEKLSVLAYKISSTDTTNTPFIEQVARTGKPVILSTGLSTLAEVTLAAQVLRAHLGERFVLLHCTSNYPARPDELNLRAMRTIAEAADCLVGYSDHT